MECARGAAKQRRFSTTVESALTSIDVLGHLATFLGAGELCQVRATCKALGSRDEAAFEGLSTAEEAARRIRESASDEEKALLPRLDGEDWIELYHHLLMLRARLTFDQLVGVHVEYQEGNKSAVRTRGGFRSGSDQSSAICGDHVMRAGKHWATFCVIGGVYLSVCGCDPTTSGLGSKEIGGVSSSHLDTLDDLRRERTPRWEGDVHLCHFYLDGELRFSNWEGELQKSIWEGVDNYDKAIGTLGMLLDLDSGTLSVYQNGRKVGTLKNGLAGIYCWFASFEERGRVSIKRGYNLLCD